MMFSEEIQQLRKGAENPRSIAGDLGTISLENVAVFPHSR